MKKPRKKEKRMLLTKKQEPKTRQNTHPSPVSKIYRRKREKKFIQRVRLRSFRREIY